MKKGKGGVASFTDPSGVVHLPGEIIDLPESYNGEKWLEPIGEAKVTPKVASSKVQPAPESLTSKPPEEPVTPKPEKKSRKPT